MTTKKPVQCEVDPDHPLWCLTHMVLISSPVHPEKFEHRVRRIPGTENQEGVPIDHQ